MNKGLLIVISSPSGGGKGTILAEFFKECPNAKLSVSVTTRNPRPGEIDKVHYHFKTKQEFEKLIQSEKMLEYATYCDNYYGTLKDVVDESLENGIDIVLEIEVQGGAQVKTLAPNCVSVFIAPPSLEVLEQRLRGRGTENEDTIQKRLNTAKQEMETVKDYDYLVINNTVKDAVEEIKAIVKAEKLKTNRL
ncbi:MAG: guanylate kinase [Clostridia bacterium]